MHECRCTVGSFFSYLWLGFGCKNDDIRYLCVMESSHIFRKSFLLMCSRLHKCSPNTIASFKVYPNRRWALNWNLYVRVENETKKHTHTHRSASGSGQCTMEQYSQCIKCYLSPSCCGILVRLLMQLSSVDIHSWCIFRWWWWKQRLSARDRCKQKTKNCGCTAVKPSSSPNNWWTILHSLYSFTLSLSLSPPSSAFLALFLRILLNKFPHFSK